MKYTGYLNLDLDNLKKRVSEGYIRAQKHPALDITLYNYAEKAQYGDVWDNEILNSRGLVLDRNTHEPVNGIFPKFFNANSANIPQDRSILSITEKLDGSFISLFNYKGKWITTTRGSFESEQAVWAAKYAAKYLPLGAMPTHLSYMFEAIYPENRVVVHYGDRAELVLLGVRDIYTGVFKNRVELDVLAAFMKVSQPKLFTFSHTDEIFAAAKAITASEEGWVVEFDDHSRLKFKGEAYILAHRVMTSVTFNRVLEAIQLGRLADMIEGVPDEFLVDVHRYQDEIETKVAEIQATIKTVMSQAPKQGVTEPEKVFRKRFATWAFEQKSRIDPNYLFKADNPKRILEMIYKNAFLNRPKGDEV